MSIAPTWCDFKTYCEAIGPGRGRLARPGQCVFCDGERVWFNGWRRVLITLLVDGQPHRPDDWVPLQRVRCGRRECGRSWTLRPAWLYPHRSLEPDVAEAAALAYLLPPHATYAAVALAVGCAWITVWRWVGWIAGLVAPAALLAQAARLDPPGPIPRRCRARCRPPRERGRPRVPGRWSRPLTCSSRSPCGIARSRSRRRTRVRSAGGSSPSSSRSAAWRA